MTSYDSGEWLVHANVLRESRSMTGLRQRPRPRPRYVTRLSRMGSLDDISRHVAMWGEKRDTVDTVYAIAKNGWFDEEGDKEEQAVPACPSREHGHVSFLRPVSSWSPLPSLRRNSSSRQKVAKRQGVSDLTKLLGRHRVPEDPQYDIFGKHLQSVRTYRENTNLGFEYGPPGSKEIPVIRAALDQDQQEAFGRLNSPPLPADWGLQRAATKQMRRKRQDLGSRPMASGSIRRLFAQAPQKDQRSEPHDAEALSKAILILKKVDSAASAVHDAPKETLHLARSAGDPRTTTQNMDHVAAKALVAEEEPRSYFEQGRNRRYGLQPAALLTKLRSIVVRKCQLSGNNKNTKNTKIVEKLRAEDAAAQAKAQLEFQAEKRHLLREIDMARRAKHQRWLEAEQDMARAQDRLPNPVPPAIPIAPHKDLEAEAQITATALDTAYNGTPIAQVTKMSTVAGSGNIRIIGPPNYGMLSLCSLWLDQGSHIREKAMEHKHGHIPRDHLVSGCDCCRYRIYEAFANNEYKYIGTAQTRMETKGDKPKLGRWVVYLAKQKPKSKFELGSRMPSLKVKTVPERRPTSANQPPRPSSMTFVRGVKARSRRIVFFHNVKLRDVGAV